MEKQKEQLDSIAGLIGVAITDCVRSLEEDETISSAKSKAGELFISTNEVVHVQITVTRDKEDFIGDFDVIENTNF